MPCLTSCCCGCSLRTGVIIIAVLILIGTTLYTTVVAKSLYDAQDESHCFPDELSKRAYIRLANMESYQRTMDDLESFQQSLHNETAIDGVAKCLENMPDYTTALSVELAITAVEWLCAALLLLGAIKEKAALLLPYLVYESVHLVVRSVMRMIAYISLLSDERTAYIGLFMLCTLICGALIALYFILVVSSYHSSLRQKKPSCYARMAELSGGDWEPKIDAAKEVAGNEKY